VGRVSGGAWIVCCMVGGGYLPWKRPPKEKKRVAIFGDSLGC
jgi:hypothetical protein